jgi:hypothetical protein
MAGPYDAFSKFMNEVWSPEVKDVLDKQPSLANSISNETDVVGSTKVHIILNGSMTAKNMGDQLAPQVVVDSEIELVLTKDKEVSYYVKDLYRLQSKYNLRNQRSKAMAKALMSAQNSDIIAMFSAIVPMSGHDQTIAEILAADTQAEAGDKIFAGVKRGKTLLELQDIPDSPRYMLWSPYISEVLLGTEKITSGDYGDDMPLVSGFLGRRMGMMVLEHRDVAVTYDEGEDETTTEFYIYHPDAAVFGSWESFEMEVSREHIDKAFLISGTNKYGYLACRAGAFVKYSVTFEGDYFGLAEAE